MSFFDPFKAQCFGALDATLCLGRQGESIPLPTALWRLAELASQRRAHSGTVFFIGAGAGDPQSHHFAAAFYRRAGLRGIALGESPFRTALGDEVRAAEMLGQWFAKPGDIVVHLLDSVPPDQTSAVLLGAARLGLHSVVFASPAASGVTGPVADLTVLIPESNPSVRDCVQHVVVNGWIAAVGADATA